MKKVIIENANLKGSIAVPPSKSAMHRILICAALSRNITQIKPHWDSADIKATVSAVGNLGARIAEYDGGYTVEGIKNAPKSAKIDCNESGSTLRFLLPVAAALGIDARFSGSGRLPERSVSEYLKLFPEKGVSFVCEKMPYYIHGRLEAGEYVINPTLSSQYITGLLLALPLLDKDSVIRSETGFTSRGYIDMTLNIMKDFGVTVSEKNNAFYVKGNGKYEYNGAYEAEGDWSQAAFYLTANRLGADIEVHGLRSDSAQGDKKIIDILNTMYGDMTVDAGQIPDLVPIISVAAALNNGETRIVNAGRLRAKESDRLAAMCDGLSRMGADISETSDGLRITGVKKLHGSKCKGYNDHRIVMALSIAAAFASGTTEIDDAQSIEKSYPTFFEDYNSLGGKANVIDVGE